jgi:hypothetical protein
MYDLYHNDHDIIQMLTLKGINSNLIQKILHKIKVPAYEKRIRQGKRSILIGIIIIGLFFVVPFAVVYIFRIDFSGGNSLQNGTRNGEGMLQIALHRYTELYLAFLGIGVINILSGIFTLSKYQKLLKATF